jgi:hypothetical protein
MFRFINNFLNIVTSAAIVGLAFYLGHETNLVKLEGKIATPSEQRASESFYQKYLFKTKGACGSANQRFYFLASTNPSTIPSKFVLNRNNSVLDVVGEVSVLLFDDHTYRAKYHEADVLYYLPKGFGFDASRDQSMKGDWSFEDGNLKLDGLGSLSITTKGKDKTLQLEVSEHTFSSDQRAFTTPLNYVESRRLPIADEVMCSRK